MALTAEQRNIGEVYQTAPTFTNASAYIEPLRASIEWWDLLKLEQKHSFDSWNPRGIGVANHINVVDCNVTPPGLGDNGSFYFTVHDTDKIIDKLTARRKGLIIIKVKKYEQDPQLNLMYGFIQKARSQLKRNQLYYTFSGIGSGVLTNERYINLRRMSRMKSIDSNIPIFDDELMQIKRLIKEILTSRDVYAVDDTAIAEQTAEVMDMTNLDNSLVNETILAINEPYVTASHAIATLLDSVGADGGIDTYNKPYLKYPSSTVATIVLKSWDTVADQGLDTASNTSYFMDSWDYELDWSKESGFANRILAKAVSMFGTATTSTTGSYGGFFTLMNKDLSQLIPASPAKFSNLAVIIERVGAGTSDPNRIKTVHGHIVEDINNSPTGLKIAEFNIPLADIPEDNPTTMFLSTLWLVRNPNPSSKHWITLYWRGTNEENTIKWYTTPSPTLQGFNASRVQNISGVPWNDHESNSGWEVAVNNSYNFAFSAFDSFTHIIIAEDVDSQKRYGLVEDLIDVSFLTNTISANKYLGEVLEIRSKPKISYHTNNVTIPNSLFMPGIIVNLQDPLSDLNAGDNMNAEITSASYQFGGSGQSSLGAIFANISMVGSYDYKIEEDTSVAVVE
jgi:hypothetical protein